jgi:hypothetical protein
MSRARKDVKGFLEVKSFFTNASPSKIASATKAVELVSELAGKSPSVLLSFLRL